MYTPPEDLLCSTDHTWHGSGIMWHTSLDSSITPLKTSNDRFASIRINDKNERFLAISIYFPTSGKDSEYNECVSDLVIFVQEYQKENDIIIIGTDSNCSEKSSQRRKLALKNLCQELSLVRAATLHPTFHHHNGSSESNIDYFLISESYSHKISKIMSICTLYTPENLSAHDPVIASLQIPQHTASSPSSDYSHTYRDFTQHKVVWDPQNLQHYQETTLKVLAEYESQFPLPEHIPLKCELFSSILVKSAQLCLQSKPVQKSIKKNRPSKYVHQAWLQLRKAFKKWKMNGKNKDPKCIYFTALKTSKGKFQQQYRRDIEFKNIRYNNTIMRADYNNKKEFFNLIKSVRSRGSRQPLCVLNTPLGTYQGLDTLEGFTADAELLGKHVGEAPEYDNEFYKLCVLDNSYIFELKGKEPLNIPEMRMEDLESILSKEMKLSKACDIYQLTTEHLRYAGPGSKQIILSLLNNILSNMYYLSCPQIKKGLSTMVYKGKKKPVSESSSHRRITVTPQLGGIIDRYIDPMAEYIFRKVQSPDQLGFTSEISYLLAALERGECQRYALDTKQTCFGVSFDGQAAFPSVDRDIQIRELYTCGERGDLLQYSINTYQNTVSHVKQEGLLGREFREYKGSRQGHKRASGHFKAYINPCLIAANSTDLGFWIGPICVTCVCVADDTYILSGDPRNHQSIINIVGHYGRRYRVTFGADKTKVTVTGSKQDMLYYKAVNIWSLHGKKLDVTDDNDHLGLIVSGVDEERKNVDKCVDSARKTLFNLLGNIFSFKCKLSQAVLKHVWSLYVSPVLRSGLASLPIRPAAMKILSNFHHKILRGILKISIRSPIAPLYFLLGELPMEAAVHLDALALFRGVWANPNTKPFEIVKYLLMVTTTSSHTWTAHLRSLFQFYNLPDPLTLLSTPVWPKERWKLVTRAAVISHWEAFWRQKALDNTKLSFINVQTIGLTGAHHAVLKAVFSTQEVMRSRVHIKMLSGDYPCSYYLASDRNQDPSCVLCKHLPYHGPVPAEDMVHLLTQCRATSETRT